MPTLIFGVVVLVLVLWALNIISKVDPKIAARVMKLGGGLLSLGFAVFLGLRGEIGIAIPLGAFDAPSFATPRFSVWEKRKCDWVEILGDEVEHTD